MIPDTHSHNVTPLSAQLLQDYVQNKLSASDRMRVKRLLSESELAATAAAGFAAVPDAFQDIASLQAEIAARSGMSGGSTPASKSWLNWLAGGAGVAAVVVLAFAFWPTNDKPKSTPPPITAKPVISAPAETPQEIVLNPATDHFVNPKSNPVVAVAPVSTAGNMPQPAETQTIPAPPDIQPPAPPVLQPTLPADAPEKKPSEPEYNFPIRYILDLKVSDYERLYSRPLKTQKLRMTGTPANEDERRTGSGQEVEFVVMADQVLREGLDAFRAQRYGRCISKFEVLLKNSPDDVNARFYMAVSYVKLEMHSKALPLLDAVIAAENNAFREEAEWYKALALIGSGDTDEARVLLRKISGDNTFYSKQAAEKLKTL